MKTERKCMNCAKVSGVFLSPEKDKVLCNKDERIEWVDAESWCDKFVPARKERAAFYADDREVKYDAD